MAGHASLLRAMELGLHPLATLVRLGFMAGNSASFVTTRRWPRPFRRWFPHQAPSVRHQPCRRSECSVHGRTKGGLNTKLCALVEGEGRLVAAVLAPGQIYEVEAAAPLFDTLKRVLLVGDKGFDADGLRQKLLAQECLASIPPRSGRRSPAWYHQGLYRKRHKVENFFPTDQNPQARLHQI